MTFEPRQIFFVHQEMWDAMERFAAQHNLHLGRLPDGANVDGAVFYSDDPEVTPTYAFMPKGDGR